MSARVDRIDNMDRPPKGALSLCPVSLAEARRCVGLHHRHNRPPVGWKFGVGVTFGNQMVGVAIAGRPVARGADDGLTVEVLRVCTNGTPNVCTMLYGAITRAAAALGYAEAITYTLTSEPGASLKASGWIRDVELSVRPTWAPSRRREDANLFGEPVRPTEAKVRWRKRLRRTT